MDELIAITRARGLVQKFDTAPIDIIDLAESYGLIVRESDQLADGQAGNTFQKGGKTFVIVNQNDDPFRQRFTIAHELGHHILKLPSIHGPQILANDLERFTDRPREEKLCDTFAAECLVPEHLIRPYVKGSEFTAKLVLDLSNIFNASRPCIASSFVRASTDLLAYVYSERGNIQHAISSASLRNHKVYIQTGPIPPNSAAAIALKNRTQIETKDLDGTDWSSSDAAQDFACYEEAVHQRKWNQTLSLLTFERVGTTLTGPGAYNEENELLPELTGYLPWPKR